MHIVKKDVRNVNTCMCINVALKPHIHEPIQQFYGLRTHIQFDLPYNSERKTDLI